MPRQQVLLLFSSKSFEVSLQACNVPLSSRRLYFVRYSCTGKGRPWHAFLLQIDTKFEEEKHHRLQRLDGTVARSLGRDMFV